MNNEEVNYCGLNASVGTFLIKPLGLIVRG